MSEHGIICKVPTSPHPDPKATRIRVGRAAGQTIIVGADHDDDQFGVFFPEGLQLSHELCMAGKLYKTNPETGEPMGGYLSDKRRVRCIKLRGVESTGIWLSVELVSKLDPTFALLLAEGEAITHFGDVELCRRYVTPQQRRQMRVAERGASTVVQPIERHYDTGHLERTRIPFGTAIITEKLHGTSGRTGWGLVGDAQAHVERSTPWGRTLESWGLLRRRTIDDRQMTLTTGTRRVMVGPGHPDGYRHMIHDLLAKVMSNLNETWYYEIVGYTETGTPIMPSHSIDRMANKDARKRLKLAADGSDFVQYHYGCAASGRMPGTRGGLDQSLAPRFKVYVYRITDEDGEVPYEVMKLYVESCATGLGLDADFLNVVPRLGALEWTGASQDVWQEHIEMLAEDHSTGPGHGGVALKEGVCVRVESKDPDGNDAIHRALKYKTFDFKVLEGIARDDDNYVDTEEVA